MLVFDEGEYPVKKTLRTKYRTNKPSPRTAYRVELDLGPHWWKASALTSAPASNMPRAPGSRSHLLTLKNFHAICQALAGECGFMAANLYARSIFGEDALANVSIEKPSDQSGPSVTGHVRIRAKSQVN